MPEKYYTFEVSTLLNFINNAVSLTKKLENIISKVLSMQIS